MYRGWCIPETASAVLDGVTVPVPVFTESMRKAIIGFADAPPHFHDHETVREWMMSRTDLEMEAMRVYFWDRWTWDTGNEYDKFAHIVAEQEIARRDEVRKALDRLEFEIEAAGFEQTHEELCKQVTNALRVPSHML